MKKFPQRSHNINGVVSRVLSGSGYDAASRKKNL